MAALVKETSSGRRPLIQQHTDGLAQIWQPFFAFELLKGQKSGFRNYAPDLLATTKQLPFRHVSSNWRAYLEVCSATEHKSPRFLEDNEIYSVVAKELDHPVKNVRNKGQELGL